MSYVTPLKPVDEGTLSNGKPGYNVSNGYRDWTTYDYIFGVCAEVGIPDTPGCDHQEKIPDKAAAYQVGVWNESDTSLWATTCNSIGDIAQSAYALIDPTNPVLGVTITWSDGTSVGCPYARQLSVSFVCDPDYNPVRPVQTIEEPSICQYKIEIKTAYGCPAQCKRGKNGMLCSGRGTCGYNADLKQAMCICDQGKTGPDCSEDKACATSKACAGTAAGSVLGTMAAIGVAGFIFIKRGGRMPTMGGSSSSTGMQSLRAPALEQTSGGRPVDMAAEYSQL